ncbi:hypothetical protein [Amycolatopsis nigrescens]|uniref:hypothetical protein n=1 Tax=Amycolatopsis nigrescens TaxID=381445 RepID=UPI00316AE0A7
MAVELLAAVGGVHDLLDGSPAHRGPLLEQAHAVAIAVATAMTQPCSGMFIRLPTATIIAALPISCGPYPGAEVALDPVGAQFTPALELPKTAWTTAMAAPPMRRMSATTNPAPSAATLPTTASPPRMRGIGRRHRRRRRYRRASRGRRDGHRLLLTAARSRGRQVRPEGGQVGQRDPPGAGLVDPESAGRGHVERVGGGLAAAGRHRRARAGRERAAPRSTPYAR